MRWREFVIGLAKILYATLLALLIWFCFAHATGGTAQNAYEASTE